MPLLPSNRQKASQVLGHLIVSVFELNSFITIYEMFKMSCGGSGEVVACNYSTNKHPFVDAITSIRPASYVRIPTLSRLIDDVISCRWSKTCA